MSSELLIVLSLILSAICSGSETVLVSLNRLKFEALQRLGVSGARLVVSFRDSPDRFLATCVVGNAIATVAWSSLVALRLEPYLDATWIAFLSTATILLLGEVFPKSLGRSVADRVAIPTSRMVLALEVMLYPLVWLLRGTGQVALRLTGAKARGERILVTRGDLEDLFVLGEKSGVLERQERTLVARLFRMRHQRVRDVMIPRTEIEAVRVDEPLYAVRKRFEETGFSRLLVYGKDLDDVKGFVHVLDLLREVREWQSAIRPALAVPESARAVQVLRRMQAQKISLAVAVDEYGGTEGLVTLEDLVEQLFGEIRDEFDYDERLVRRLGERTFIVRGRAEISYLNEAFGLDLPTGDYATLSGLLNEVAGRIPQPGDVFRIGRWQLRVLSTERKRVEWVRVEPLAPGQTQDSSPAGSLR
jgi:CBS domain containing-hemolysin-like protein